MPKPSKPRKPKAGASGRPPGKPAGRRKAARTPPRGAGPADPTLERRLLEQVFEDSEQAILVYDRRGNILHANRAVARWYGYPERRLRAMNATDLIAPPYRSEFDSRVRKLLRHGHRVVEAVHVRRDGTCFDVEVSSWVLRGGRDPRLVSILRDVTERKHAKRALDLVLSGAPCLLWQTTVAGREDDGTWIPAPLDEAAAQRFLPLNRRRRESYGRAWLRARIGPDGRKPWEAAREAIRRGRTAYGQEFACLDAQGETRWIHEDVRIEALGRGRWRLTGVCTDVTARRLVEDALRENVERFAKVFEEGPLGMALVGRDLSFLRVNRTLCRMLGYTESELRARGVEGVTHPDDLTAKRRLLRRAFAGKIPFFIIETRYLTKDGAPLWVNLTASVVRDVNGQPLHGLVMLEDISERKRASADMERNVEERTRALIESHRRNEVILRTAIDGYFVIDERAVFIEVNDAYCAMTGYSRDEILGMRLADLEAIASERDIAGNLRRLKREGGDRFETRHRRKDGNQVNLEIGVNYLQDEAGGRYIVFARDITARKRVHKALREAHDELEQRVEERTAELRNAVSARDQEIAERERAEAGLRESEAKLTALIENATEALWSIDTEGHIIAFNSYFRKQFIAAFGKDPQVGDRMDDLLAEPEFAATLDYLNAQLARALGGERFAVETAYRLGGEKHYYIVSLHPIIAADRVRGATVYAKDITELKLAEKTLGYQVEFEKLIARVSQTFLNAAPGNLDGAIQETLDLLGRFTGADRSRMFLFTPDLGALESVHEWCAEGVASSVDRVRRIPADLVPRSAHRLLRGEVFKATRLDDLPPGSEDVVLEFRREGIRSLAAVALISKGAPIGFLALHAVKREREWPDETIRLLRIVAEITSNALERTRAQRKLEDLGRQHQLILDSAGEGIFGVDATGRATFVNPAAARMLGWAPEAIIGEHIHPLFHHTRPDGSPCPPRECPILRVLDGDLMRSMQECVFWRRGGKRFPVELISTPIRDRGRTLGAVVAFKDISERKRGEEALRRVVEGTSSTLGEGFFRSLVEHLAAALRVRFAFVSELVDNRTEKARLLAFWRGDGFGECFEYPLAGTPCERVFLDGAAIYPSGLSELFPEDAWLRERGAESYLALPLHDARGVPIGHLGVMDDRPFERSEGTEPILRIFAARAGAELERKHAEEALDHRLRFEKVIGEVSKRFVNADPESTGTAIDDALRIVGSHSGVDRAYLFTFSEDLSLMDNSNEWCAEGIEPQIQRIQNHPTGDFAWAMERLARGEPLQIPRTADLPDDAAAEKAEFDAQGIKSLLNVPVIYRNELVGFVGFDAVRNEKTWDDQSLRLLELFAEIMASALARERAERQLKELGHKNQLILDAAGEGIFGLDLEGSVTFVNPAAARMLGWEVQNIIGRAVHAVVHGEARGWNMHRGEACPIERALRAGAVHRADEDLFRRKDGSTFPVEFMCTPLLENGRNVGGVATFNDITLRKRTDELRYQAHLLSQVPDAVLVMDEDGAIKFWSKGAESLTGYPAPEVIGRNLGHLLGENDPGGGLPGILERISAAGVREDYQGEHLVRRKDGQTRLIGVHLSPSPDPDGEGRNWIGVAQDVTEARGLQEEILQAQRLAEVGTLAAGVAHEINNPLTVLSGNLQMMLERAAPDDPNRGRYEQMKRVADRISEVVNGLSRIAAPRGEQWGLANVNEILEETLVLVEQLNARKGVRILRRFAPDLPKLRVLQNGLQQLLLNIVMNALDAIDGDGEIVVETCRGPDEFVPRRGFLSPPPSGHSDPVPEGPSVRIKVTDTGCGIPKGDLPKIFLPFFTSKEPGKGTGLGLAVARSIASIHRGSIEVESREGRGTVFTVTLPAS